MDSRKWREPFDERVLCEAKPLARGSVLRLRGRDALVFVHAGMVWLTQEGDALDHVVKGGQSLRIDCDGPVCIEALRPTLISISAPLEAWTVEIFGPRRKPLRGPRFVRNARAWWLRFYRFGRRAAALRALTNV